MGEGKMLWQSETGFKLVYSLRHVSHLRMQPDFMAGFLHQEWSLWTYRWVPVLRSWHETVLTKTKDKRIPAYSSAQLILRQALKKKLKGWSFEGKLDIDDINYPSRFCSRNATSLAFSKGTEVNQSVGFHTRRVSAAVLKKMYKFYNDSLPPTVRLLS